MTNATDFHRIERAIAFLTEHAADQPSLADVAQHLDLTAHHVQRLFKRYAGVSPKRFLQALTLEHAKERLAATRTVLDTAFDVGLSGGGRLHDLFVAGEGASPGEFVSRGDSLTIRLGRADTAWGPAFVARTDRGLCALAFEDADPDAEVRLRARWPEARFVADPRLAAGVVRAVFDGERPSLHVRGTNLQLQVWRALLRVPEGALVSYGDLARRLGRPTAARAVAGAVARNAVAVLVPCHRVLRGTGALGGYRWGTTRKRLLLARESG